MVSERSESSLAAAIDASTCGRVPWDAVARCAGRRFTILTGTQGFSSWRLTGRRSRVKPTSLPLAAAAVFVSCSTAMTMALSARYLSVTPAPPAASAPSTTSTRCDIWSSVLLLAVTIHGRASRFTTAPTGFVGGKGSSAAGRAPLELPSSASTRSRIPMLS